MPLHVGPAADGDARLDSALRACASEIQTLTEKQAALLDRLARSKDACGRLGDALGKMEPLIILVRDHIAGFEQGRDERLRRLNQISLAVASSGRAMEALAERVAWAWGQA